MFFGNILLVPDDFKVTLIISGYPDFILDPEELNKKYVGLEIKDNEYFLNNIRINQFRIKENLLKLDQPVNKSRLEYNLYWKSRLTGHIHIKKKNSRSKIYLLSQLNIRESARGGNFPLGIRDLIVEYDNNKGG